MRYEPMPLPESGDADFPAWLVPARNNIQRQLLRLQDLLGSPTKKGEKPPAAPVGDDRTWKLGWLLGIGFSLWRAVFQAGKALDRDLNFEGGRVLLDNIIRNNAAVYQTELNSWSLGYYLNNARFRILAARKLFETGAATTELDGYVGKIEKSLTGNQEEAPSEWIDCFHAMRIMLDLVKE